MRSYDAKGARWLTITIPLKIAVRAVLVSRRDTLSRAFEALDVAPIISLVPRPPHAPRRMRSPARAASGRRKSLELDWGPPRGKEVW